MHESTYCFSGFLTPSWSSHLRRFPYMTSFCPMPLAGLLFELSTAAYITEGWLSGIDISTGKGFRQYISIITVGKGLTCVWISVPFLCIYMYHTENITRTRQIWDRKRERKIWNNFLTICFSVNRTGKHSSIVFLSKEKIIFYGNYTQHNAMYIDVTKLLS